jgi:hypothetical protein
MKTARGADRKCPSPSEKDINCENTKTENRESHYYPQSSNLSVGQKAGRVAGARNGGAGHSGVRHGGGQSPQLVTAKEAASMLRISRNKVANLLPRVRLSAHGTRYDVDDIVRFIESKKESQ